MTRCGQDILGVHSGVNKKPFACPFQDRQFQNPDRLKTVSEIFACDGQF